MKFVYNTLSYGADDAVYLFNDTLQNAIDISVYIQIDSEKFQDYQKEIFEEFVANFVDQAQDPALSPSEVEKMLEHELGALNAKLQTFADRLPDLPRFYLKGYVQLIVDNAIKTWMIGKSTLIIFRDDKMYSVLENTYQEQNNIDQFSDFIGGDIEKGDVFLYAGTKLSEVFDQQDFLEIENILGQENAEAVLHYMDDVLESRIDKKEIGFINTYAIALVEFAPRTKGSKIGGVVAQYASKLTSKISSKIDLMKWKKKTQKVFKGNKYYLMVGVLILAILFLSLAILTQFWNEKSNKIIFTASNGTTMELTIDSLKKDVAAFRLLDSSSDEKSMKYSDILQKISFIEEKGLRQNDILELKNILNQNYEQGFMVRTISSLTQFDDDKTGRKTGIITFNPQEKAKLGAPVAVEVDANIHIGGEKAALIGAINDATRGSLIEYNIPAPMKYCGLSLSKKGLYCYGEEGDMIFINKMGIEPMEVVDNDRATKKIGGIGTFGRSSFYLFQQNPNNMGSALLTRYRSVAGSESKFQSPSNYTILANSGANLPMQLAGFGIDGNFFARGDGKLYQFWRISNVGTSLDYREVPILGGDKVSSSYSNNVKVLVMANSPYVYLFDRDNQTFTVYESSPTKTNDNYKTNFKLYYMFRFKFDLSATNNRIIDMTVPGITGDRPELYILSKEGVNKINLYDFIDSLKNNKNLKAVNEETE